MNEADVNVNIGTDDLGGLIVFSAAAVFIVKFLRGLLGEKILTGSRTQAMAMLVSGLLGAAAAFGTRDFKADTSDIVTSIFFVFTLGQTIYNLGFRQEAGVPDITDQVKAYIASRRSK